MPEAPFKKPSFSIFHPGLEIVRSGTLSARFPPLPGSHMLHGGLRAWRIGLKEHQVLMLREVASADWFFVYQAETAWFDEAFPGTTDEALNDKARRFWSVMGRLPLEPLLEDRSNEVSRQRIDIHLYAYAKQGLGIGSAENCAHALVERLPQSYEEWLSVQDGPEKLARQVQVHAPVTPDRASKVAVKLHGRVMSVEPDSRQDPAFYL